MSHFIKTDFNVVHGTIILPGGIFENVKNSEPYSFPIELCSAVKFNFEQIMKKHCCVNFLLIFYYFFRRPVGMVAITQ